MSQSKISQMKQKVVSKLHRQKTDTSHMTGKNTDLPATRSALNSNHSMGSRFPSENPNHEHNPGVITATQSTHFDHASHVTDQVRQNPDHIIRQDSEEGLYDSQKQYPSQTYTSTRAPIATGIPTTLPSTASYASQPMVQPIAQPIAQPIVAPMATSMTTMSTSSVAPTTFTDSVEKYDCEVVTKPAIVHEVIKNEELHQVQPVIERTREQTDIYEVVQPISEREIRPTEVRVATLPAKHIPIVRETEFIESQATIPVQIVKTIHVPVSQLTQVTTTRMMSTQEARSYETTQMSGQFMEKTQLNPTLLTQSTLPAQQSSTF